MDTAFTITALIGGTVLAFQFVMMLMGLGDDGGGTVSGDHGGSLVSGEVSAGLDADLTGDVTGEGSLDHPGMDGAHAADGPFHWFYEVISLRTLSAALTFFGITGNMMLAFGYRPWPAFIWASLAGIAALYGVYWLFRQVFRLQHAGNEDIRNAIGLDATVYIPIPGNRAGAGKVTFRLQERLVEYQAVTENERRLTTGEKVVIVGIVSSDTVRVARAGELAPV